jgi:hypothetical protein
MNTSDAAQVRKGSRGFTLLAALLILVLLSGLSLGLLYTVSNVARQGGNDLENNLAYYGAEAGMEKMTSDLANLYQGTQAPTPAQITALASQPPTSAMVGSISYNQSITWNADANGNPVPSWNTVSAGPNQGLVAEIIPMTLTVNATRPSFASVNMTRRVEVALIPVFQFGVFCGGDCSYFAGPQFNFGGRVHTNGNLFLASGSSLILGDKVSAFGEIILDQLSNGHPTSSGYGGQVYVPNAPGGCSTTWPSANCLLLPVANASWSGGIPPAGAANPNFPSISSSTFNGFLTNGTTGASNLQLPFVGSGVDPIQIIRKSPVGEGASSTTAQSRLYNKATIRILLADTLANLHPERGTGSLDADDVNLSNFSVAISNPVGTAYMAQANTGVAGAGWVAPYGSPVGTTTWPLVNGWLRVEYQDNGGVWRGVTNEWLKQGFGRGPGVPTNPLSNSAMPNAILILQEQADWDGDGAIDHGERSAVTGAGSQNNWYPINLYDTREGEARDTAQAAQSCTANGVMNVVELDVGNLGMWLRGVSPYGGLSGTGVNYSTQNGYVLYFSDRRGMLPDPNAPAPYTNTLYGESGLEDVINSASAGGTPDGALEPATYYPVSPEDVDGNRVLDAWGAQNLGYGFNINTGAALPYNAYSPRLNCFTLGRQNAVTGARHALKLIDGSLGRLPVRPDNSLGGFTVASENPVYVQGDYNSSAADPFWTDPTQNNTPHSAAAVIADAVTLLSNNWSDLNSMKNPTSVASRPGTSTHYRMAIAGGKNMSFPQPSYGGQDLGTDGGLHNFLRYLESWGSTLYYNGSLVSLYYSEYATGIFKCCTTVYSPPNRQYSFDTLFLNPTNLPPATPMFQDVVNLSYHQNFTPQ